MNKFIKIPTTLHNILILQKLKNILKIILPYPIYNPTISYQYNHYIKIHTIYSLT